MANFFGWYEKEPGKFPYENALAFSSCVIVSLWHHIRSHAYL
jgi:hypothetical protein